MKKAPDATSALKFTLPSHCPLFSINCNCAIPGVATPNMSAMLKQQNVNNFETFKWEIFYNLLKYNE